MQQKRQIIISGSVENMYPSGHGGGGGGSEVAGAVDAVDDLSGAADGGDDVGPEVVGVEVMVLGAGAGARAGSMMELIEVAGGEVRVNAAALTAWPR